MRTDVLELVVAALAERAGLEISGTMRDRLSRCVHRSAETARVPVDEYAVALLANPAQLQRLIEEVTVQESSFFRDSRQFDALAEQVLPRLRGPVRIWSAGCARGQEPYSLAMLLLELGYADASVIATDVSTEALAYAEAGRYPETALRGLPAQRRTTWLAKDGAGWRVRDAPRRLVTFGRNNLAVDPPPFRPGHCQVIFCRNVLIYFRRDALLAVLARMRQWLPPGGVLFLGYSESLWQVTDMFELVRLGDAFVYRKPDDTAAAAPAVPHPTAPVHPPPRAFDLLAGHRSDRAAADAEPLPTVAELLRRGEAAMGRGDLPAATSAFRQAAYLDGGQPIAHLQLGLALEADGKPVAAARAFRAARTALHRAHEPGAELLGYRPDALVRLIDAKLAGEPA